jgi:hypothetical protein
MGLSARGAALCLPSSVSATYLARGAERGNRTVVIAVWPSMGCQGMEPGNDLTAAIVFESRGCSQPRQPPMIPDILAHGRGATLARQNTITRPGATTPADYRLLRISRNSLGPLTNRRLRRCRSSSGADGSIRRFISRATTDAFAVRLVRTPARWASARAAECGARRLRNIPRLHVLAVRAVLGRSGCVTEFLLL